jgi:hypothetical protein
VDANLAATWLLTMLLTWLIGDDVGNDEDADVDFLRGIFVDGVFWYTKHVHYTLVWICLWN